MASRPKHKVHLPVKKLIRSKSGNSNLRMFCGKVFASGDRERLKKHVTSYPEEVNCFECVDAIHQMWVEKKKKHWFVKEDDDVS